MWKGDLTGFRAEEWKDGRSRGIKSDVEKDGGGVPRTGRGRGKKRNREPRKSVWDVGGRRRSRDRTVEDSRP